MPEAGTLRMKRMERELDRFAKREAEIDRAQANLSKMAERIDDEMIALFRHTEPKAQPLMIPPQSPKAAPAPAPAANPGNGSSFVPAAPAPVPSLQDIVKPAPSQPQPQPPESPKAPSPLPASGAPAQNPAPAGSPKAPPPLPQSVEASGWKGAISDAFNNIKTGLGNFFEK